MRRPSETLKGVKWVQFLRRLMKGVQSGPHLHNHHEYRGTSRHPRHWWIRARWRGLWQLRALRRWHKIHLTQVQLPSAAVHHDNHHQYSRNLGITTPRQALRGKARSQNRKLKMLLELHHTHHSLVVSSQHFTLVVGQPEDGRLSCAVNRPHSLRRVAPPSSHQYDHVTPVQAYLLCQRIQ